MRTKLTMTLTASAACLLLCACSQPPEPKADGAASPAAATVPEKSHVKTPFDAMLKDKAKAKAVQQTVLDQAAKQRKAIKAAGG